MNNLCKKIRGYYVSLYELLWSTLKELVICEDITYVAIGIVLLIIIIFSSLILLFKKKDDEIFAFPAEIIPQPVRHHIDHQHDNRDSKTFNYKSLLTELHYMTSKCCETYYASKCIRLVRDCPCLMNVCLEKNGLTPFQRVCYNGHTCLIEYMLMKGADPLLETQSGENGLCLAIYYCLKHPQNSDLSCLDVLFRSGCNLQSNSRWFDVVMKMATRVRHKSLIEWLLLHAQPTAPNLNFRSVSLPAGFRNSKGSRQRQLAEQLY